MHFQIDVRTEKSLSVFHSTALLFCLFKWWILFLVSVVSLLIRNIVGYILSQVFTWIVQGSGSMGILYCYWLTDISGITSPAFLSVGGD